MKGQCYAIIDTISENVVVYFHAANEADARRFVRTNFEKSPVAALDGLQVVLLLCWDEIQVDGMVAGPEIICWVAEWLPIEPDMRPPSLLRKEQIEEAQRGGAFRK